MVPNFNDIEIIRDTSILNNIAVEKEKFKKENVKILNKKEIYNIFNRPILINFLSYMLMYKHSNYAIKYFQEPILHNIQNIDLNFKEIKLQKPTLFINKITKIYFKYSYSRLFRNFVLALYKLLRLMLRFRRKFFLTDRIINANKS